MPFKVMSDPAYQLICQRIWQLYERLRLVPTTTRNARNVLFPPPRRRERVDVLIVGITPNQKAALNFCHSFPELQQFAGTFRYTSGALGNPGCHYDPYYGELMKFIRRVDTRFGVWWEVECGDRQFFTEFTDALHIASEPGNDDISRLVDRARLDCPTWSACKEILSLELKYYAPRVVIGNGRLPSDLLWEIITGKRAVGAPTTSILRSNELDCVAHLSGFITSKSMDGYSKARLVEEIRTHARFL